MKPKKAKIFVAKVEIIQHKTPDKRPDFGLGKGVLGQQEVKFTDDRGRGFGSPLFAMALMEHEDRLIKESVKVVWQEKGKRGKTFELGQGLRHPVH